MAILRTTHTYAVLEVSSAAFEEIKQKLLDAGYDHAVDDGIIDMHGIALSSESKLELHDGRIEPTSEI